jgi:hypothetical protein
MTSTQAVLFKDQAHRNAGVIAVLISQRFDQT